jgi:hypothetical protein
LQKNGNGITDFHFPFSGLQRVIFSLWCGSDNFLVLQEIWHMRRWIQVFLFLSWLTWGMGQSLEFHLGANMGLSKERWGDVNGKGVYHSFGQGIEAGGRVVLPFQESLGAEAGLQFLAGIKRVVKKGDETYEFTSSLLSIPFGLRLQAKVGASALYTRFGALLGMVPRAKIVFSDPDLIRESEYSKGLAGGFYSALGIQIPFGSDLYFFGELGYQNVNWKPRELKVVADSDTYILTLVKDNPGEKEDYAPNLPYSALKVHVGIGKTF